MSTRKILDLAVDVTLIGVGVYLAFEGKYVIAALIGGVELKNLITRFLWPPR